MNALCKTVKKLIFFGLVGFFSFPALSQQSMAPTVKSILQSVPFVLANSNIRIQNLTEQHDLPAGQLSFHTIIASSFDFSDNVSWGFPALVGAEGNSDNIDDIYHLANVDLHGQITDSLVQEFSVGYTKQLAGSKQSYYSVGITFIKQAALDVGWIDSLAGVDENKATRSAFVSFAIQTKF